MKTTPQKLAVSLHDSPAVLVTFYCTHTPDAPPAPLVDLHLQFRDGDVNRDVHLTEAIQQKAARRYPLLQIIVEDIVQEYFYHPGRKMLG